MREYMENMEKRIRPEEKDQLEIVQLKGETTALKASYSRRPSDKLGGAEDPELVERLQDQAETIQDLRQMVEYQVSLQTSLVREIDCLKDQVDLLREQWHNHSDSSGCRFEEEEGGERIGNLASLASLASLV